MNTVNGTYEKWTPSLPAKRSFKQAVVCIHIHTVLLFHQTLHFTYQCIYSFFEYFFYYHNRLCTDSGSRIVGRRKVSSTVRVELFNAIHILYIFRYYEKISQKCNYRCRFEF